ncbi:hypothetical protein [Ensifer sp. LCM 4579]|uniref:hypothetical protein n=1 Tax=Ensifer sp. LCM 4579 TaxID=1848292 RepID=UPI0010427FEB|nr:hypothetical protein [Ensifer sp. LCM 4579]
MEFFYPIQAEWQMNVPLDAVIDPARGRRAAPRVTLPTLKADSFEPLGGQSSKIASATPRSESISSAERLLRRAKVAVTLWICASSFPKMRYDFGPMRQRFEQRCGHGPKLIDLNIFNRLKDLNL